ncbi:MAG: APC family permease [bacterium]
MNTTSLKRCLGLWEIVIYGVGLILGAGIYVLIGAAAGIAGNMLWLAFLVAALVASFTALSYAELSAMFPAAGAEFVFAREAFSSRAVAWITGFCGLVVGFAAASAVAVGFARYINFFFPVDTIVAAASLIVLMSFLNYWGIKESARFNAIATSVEVGGLVLIIVIGGYQITGGVTPLADLLKIPPVAPDAWSFLPVVSAGALIFFAYLGFEDIANIAEEAQNPHRDLPRAFMYALVISTVVYILVAVVAVSVVPYQELAAADQPLALIMEKLIGGIAPILIAVIALFATANTVLITLIVSARMLYGMASDGSMPSSLSKVSHSRYTPYMAVSIAGAASIAFLFFKQLEVLASITDVGIFILFLIVNLSNILLRVRRPELPRPWRAPFSIGNIPVVSVLGAFSCVALLVTINHPVKLFGNEYSSLLVGLTIFAMAVPCYFLFGRRRLPAL